MLSIANAAAISNPDTITMPTLVAIDEPNLALAPDEIASLTSLMKRYDQVLLDIDALNVKLQELLERHGPAKTETSVSD